MYRHTLARNIIFGTNKTATGVNVTTGSFPSTGSRTYVLNASKEVILSAGAVIEPLAPLIFRCGFAHSTVLVPLTPNTHRLRHRSGGNVREEYPRTFRSPRRGQGLRDQPLFSLVYNLSVTKTSSLSNATYAAHAVQEYQTGPLTDTGYNEVGKLYSSRRLQIFGLKSIGWEKLPASSRLNLSATALSDLSHFPADWPEIEYVAFAGDLCQPPANTQPFGVALVAPLSRGNVTIVSADTKDRPLISPNWLTSITDREVGVQAFRRARKIAEGSGIAISEALPGLAVQSDEEILNYLEEATVPIHHASATCEAIPFRSRSKLKASYALTGARGPPSR